MSEMSDRRKDGPINGKVGLLLAGIRQLTPLFGWVGVLFVLFGFQFSSPGKQLIEVHASLVQINTRIDRVENYVEALVRVRCSEIEPPRARLAGLDCGSAR